MSTLEEIEQRRAARKAKLEQDRNVQLATDMEEVDRLEQQHGDGRVAYVETPAYTPGMPALAIVRAPNGAEYKRFRDKIMSAKGSGPAMVEAQDLLAATCVLYPDRDTYKRMCEQHAGLHVACSLVATKLAEGRQAEEGKS